jgi:hypothetical protein
MITGHSDMDIAINGFRMKDTEGELTVAMNIACDMMNKGGYRK